MALITHLDRYELENPKVHDAVSAFYAVFGEDGGTFIQIITRGRDSRVHAGTTSQTIQFDRTSAKELFDALRLAFQFT